jgi:hypothetical protein
MDGMKPPNLPEQPVGVIRQNSWSASSRPVRAGTSPAGATAKVERSSQRGNGERNQGRERQAERGGDFNDPAPF